MSKCMCFWPATLLTVFCVSPAMAADHLDAPLVQLDGRTDINDFYMFQSPENSDNTVMVMTVNPAAGVLSGTTFDQEADYNFNLISNFETKFTFTSRTPVRGPRPLG